MKKIVIVFFIILFFTIFQSNIKKAKFIDYNKLNYLNIHTNGQVLSSYTPPRAVVENNMFLLIVSFIICSTICVNLDYGLNKKYKYIKNNLFK